MKKYFLGIAAVVLAISFSAFNNASSSKADKKVATDLYWYYFDNSTGYLDGEISSSPISHATAKAATDCPDTEQSTIDCARGFAQQQMNPYNQTPGAGDDQVKRLVP